MMGRSKSNKTLQWRKRWCHSGVESWWHTSLWTSPPRPLSLVTMSVTLMAASCDSIGSCSLDVDAESLNDALIDSAQVDSSHNHRNPGELQANAPSLSKQTLHSLLLSAGANSGGQISDNLDNTQANLGSPSPTAKKPSYLNLACSISGYGGITTYDSKLREGFRSRDHSPGKLIGIQNGSREASPARALGAASSTSGNLLAAPNSERLCWTPSPVGGQVLLKSDMTNISPTFGGSRRFNSTNCTDQIDATGNFNVKRISDQRNRWLESTLTPLEKNKDYQQVVTVVESKFGRHELTSETSVETKYEVNSRSQSTTVSSKTVFSSSSHPQQYLSTPQTGRVGPFSREGNSQSDQNGHVSGKQCYTNGSAMHQTPVASKSFIQQRVERLYGPCALAQGFFHRNGKSSSPSSSCDSPGANGLSSQLKPEKESNPETLGGSPALPVLRHLRPEFRDQLTVAPRKSLSPRFSNGSSPKSASSETSPRIKQGEVTIIARESPQKTSAESLSDHQPAAPEVVLPQQSPSIAPTTKVADIRSIKEATEAVLPSELSSSENSKIALKTYDNVLSAPLPDVACGEAKAEEKEENAGHKFLKIQKQTIEKLLVLAMKAELEIEESGSNGKPVLSEEALGHLRAAAGKARLLVTQKMVQFEGLCHKCISQHPGEPFPTTGGDLQGFWDMLLLQVDQVHTTFEHLEKLKAVGWCEDKLAAEDQLKSSEPTAARASTSAFKRTSRTSKALPSTSAKSAETAALRKQREEERKKLVEQRRRELKQKQQTEENSSTPKETVEIFGAESS